MSEKFSYSKLDCYNGCPFKFYLNYELGNFAYSSNIAVEFGSAVHLAEEKIATAIQANIPIDYISIKNEFILKLSELEYKYPKEFFEKDKSDRTYREKAYQYLDSGIYRLEKYMLNHPSYKIVGIEQKFNFIYDENHTFNGAIDRVFLDTDTNKYIIQDIKTYAVPIKQDDLITPLQFVIYTLAAQEIWGVSFDQISCQYDLPLVDIIQNGGTAGYMARGLKKIKELFLNITDKNFKPKPSQLCHWCSYCKTNNDAKEPYKYLCPYFMHWTRELKDFSKENDWNGLDEYPIILEAFKKKYGII